MVKRANVMWNLAVIFVLFCFNTSFSHAQADSDSGMSLVDAQIASHPDLSGAYVLNQGAIALMTRAWLADHAEHSIEVQYFIWSDDNIGTLASEALLRAAERGVKVRVIVDDLLIHAPDKTILALAKHPNIDIRIYNPKHSVGTPFYKRLFNIATDFRGVNQRMHDKTFIVDGKVAITGGRNMAAEYFDYSHTYNFRDRDLLLLGPVVHTMQHSFETFWKSNLTVSAERLYNGAGFWNQAVRVKGTEVEEIYASLHQYARRKDNYAPEVYSAITAMSQLFPSLADQVVWDHIVFISDFPGKNSHKTDLDGGGKSTSALATLVDAASNHIVIQSPYLVMSAEAKALFKRAIKRGVKVRIHTNSMASTDNLQAFSGYRNQRDALLKMGIDVYEFKPHPAEQLALTQNAVMPKGKPPVFAIHAKTMVVDSKTLYVGTFNFDPRSQNLNTEVGAIMQNEKIAGEVLDAIQVDMLAENSWNAATDNPDQYAGLLKRMKVRLWQWLPIQALL